MLKLTSFLFGLLLLGCKVQNKHVPTKDEIEKTQIDLVENQLSYSKEKIVLLSVIKRLPYDTLFSILRDYNFALNVFNEDFNKALFYTTVHHNFSKKQIASFVFSFNYEMISRDDILDETDYHDD
ncbi:MAG: hypothetical protein ABIN04_12785 [Ginsengibacter sp.]